MPDSSNAESPVSRSAKKSPASPLLLVACHRCTTMYQPGEGDRSSRTSALTNGRRLCPQCRYLLGHPEPEPRFSSPRRWHAADSYRGETRRLVTALKYRNDTAAVVELADRLVAAIRADSLIGESRTMSGSVSFDVVTWAPTSSRRRRRRGYDQSELLARAVARRLGLPCRRLLFRDRSRHQTGRSRRERLERSPVFTARPMRRPGRILVIDDVVTTGSTLRAAGHALELAGATKVVLFAAAATPDEHPESVLKGRRVA
ncbi:MAG: ComF family protein [Ilumatobacteraceae bacterium]